MRIKAVPAALLLAPAGLAAAQAAKDPALALDPEMQQEMDKAETDSLDNSLSGARLEAGKAHARLRWMMAAGVSTMKAAQADLERLLKEPEDLRKRLRTNDERGTPDPIDSLKESADALAMSSQLLESKAGAYAVSAGSALLSLGDAEEQKQVYGPDSYNARNREGDLKRALSDLKKAEKRWGRKKPAPEAQQALDALDSYLAEIKDGLAQAARASAVLKRAGDRGLGQDAAELETRLKDLAREGELLRSEMLLCRYEDEAFKSDVGRTHGDSGKDEK